MTKKILALAVCIAMIISLAGCGDKDKKTKKTKAEVDSSSLVDESSTADSSTSDSSVADVTTATTKAETSQITTKAPIQTTKPATTAIKTTTVAAGCYQAELANVKGWDNKYRPAGKFAYIKYGTQSAQQYYEVVKAAYDFAHNTTLVNKYKQIGVNIVSSVNGDINKFFDRHDSLIPKDDNNFVMVMASSDYLTTTYTLKDSNESSALQLGNAYNIIKNKTGTNAEFYQLIIAFANQCDAQALYCKVTEKLGLVNFWMKITDSKGQVWYIDDSAYTQKEVLAAGNKITVSDYMG